MSIDEPQAESADAPHPEIAGLLQAMGAGPVPPLSSLSAAGAREYSKAMFPAPVDPQPVGDVQELAITDAGIPVRMYVPEAEGPYPTLVYYHGGGWVIGDLDTHDETCRLLCAETDCLVVAVDYRRAPEHPFPTPLDDCYAAFNWVHDHASALQVDTDNVLVGGDSAGGNLAAAVSLRNRDEGGPPIARQVLVYPATDATADPPSYADHGDGGLLTEDNIRWFWDHYLDSPVDAYHPYASPLKARSLADLPPATVVTCGLDPLRDEGVAYAERLADADIPVEHHNYPEYIHGIVQMVGDQMELDPARELLADVAADIRTTVA